MDPARLDIKTLKRLSKNELARLALKYAGIAAEREKEIEEHKAWKLTVVEVLRHIADNAEQMKLKAQEYYISETDPVAKDFNAQLGRLVQVQITTLHRLTGLLNGMAPGSEKITSTEKKKSAGDENENENENVKADGKDKKEPKKHRYHDIPIETVKCLANALTKVDLNAPADEITDAIQKILKANLPPVKDSEPNNAGKGRRSNKGELETEDFKFKEMPPVTTCPSCGGNAIERSFYKQVIKSKPTVMKENQGVATPVLTTNYWCPHCKKFHVVSQGNDYPISTTRNIGMKPIVLSFWLHYLGMALNRAGASFEKGALLGSDTINRNSFELALIYIWPLYEVLLRRLKEQKIIVADETVYNVTQPMGYGKRPEAEKDSEGTCSQTYILSFGTPFRSLVQLHAYALMEGRGGEEIAKILDATYKFLVLITDAYQGYDKVLEIHPDCKHQVCLIHFRRHLIKGAWGEQAARDFMALDEAGQIAVMEKAKAENGVFYKVARIFQIIGYIYQWENEIAKARGDPGEISKIRKKQTALMDGMDSLMEELSEGRIKQSKKGKKWTATFQGDPLAEACTFYYNNRQNFRYFLAEDNFEIPPDSSYDKSFIVARNRKLSRIYH